MTDIFKYYLIILWIIHECLKCLYSSSASSDHYVNPLVKTNTHFLLHKYWVFNVDNTERPKEQIKYSISLLIDNSLAIYFQTICTIVFEYCQQLFSKVITICPTTSSIG